MSGKTPVTALQEFCVKKLVAPPRYVFSPSSDGSKKFVCSVTAFTETADGLGISQKAAKQDAAANIIKKLESTYADLKQVPIVPHESVTDNIREKLQHFCLRELLPIPFIDIIHQTQPPESPMFTAECRVGAICRTATATTKSGAKQLACQQVLNIIEKESPKIVPTQEIDLEYNDEIDKQHLKDYRERVKSENGTSSRRNISDRHNFFKNINRDLKNNAIQVLEDTSIVSDKDKAFLLLNELKIKYKIHQIDSDSEFVELLCDLDVVFMSPYQQIYKDILDYFRDMLK